MASTSSWIAALAIISGVCRRPVYITSIPASRNALAITLAPRSCPSRPGFAIKTRIFCSTCVVISRSCKLFRHRHCERPEGTKAIRHEVSLRGAAEATSLGEIPRFPRNDLPGQIAEPALRKPEGVAPLPRNDSLLNAYESNDDRLGIFAPDLSKDVHDFALGRVGPNCIENLRHQQGPAPPVLPDCRLAQGVERPR